MQNYGVNISKHPMGSRSTPLFPNPYRFQRSFVRQMTLRSMPSSSARSVAMMKQPTMLLRNRIFTPRCSAVHLDSLI